MRNQEFQSSRRSITCTGCVAVMVGENTAPFPFRVHQIRLLSVLLARRDMSPRAQKQAEGKPSNPCPFGEQTPAASPFGVPRPVPFTPARPRRRRAALKSSWESVSFRKLGAQKGLEVGFVDLAPEQSKLFLCLFKRSTVFRFSISYVYVYIYIYFIFIYSFIHCLFRY